MRIVVPAPMTHTSLLLEGLSYWRIKLTTGREFSEGDIALLQGRVQRIVERQAHFALKPGRIDWANDIVGSGDSARIAEISLVTPAGNATLLIGEPSVAFQMHRGALDLLSGQRTIQAQIIGRVEDKATGACRAVIWDVLEQRLYTDFITNVHDFQPWRLGVTPIGALSLRAMGVEL